MLTRIRRSIVSQRQLVYTFLLAMLYQCLVWLVLFPRIGLSQWAYLLANATLFISAIALVLVFGLGFKRIGLGLENLGWAVITLFVALIVVMLAGIALRSLGIPISFFRARYSVSGFAKTWMLVSMGEALLFGGVMYTLARRGLPDRFAWRKVLLIAVFYAVFQLPTHVALGRFGPVGFASLGESIRAIASDFTLWVICGMIYELGENLWLLGFSLATSRYALTPLIVEQPVLALLFYVIIALVAWWLERPEGWASDAPATVGMGDVRRVESED